MLSKKAENRFQKERFAKRIYRQIISNEAVYTRTVFTSFGLSSILIILLILYFTIIISALGTTELGFIKEHLPEVDNKFAVHAENFHYWIPFIAIGIPAFIYNVLSLFRIFFYFSEKLKFHKALNKVLPEQKTIWRRLSLWKLLLLYYSSAIPPAIIIISITVMIIALAFFGYFRPKL